jgi:hypothetical protein
MSGKPMTLGNMRELGVRGLMVSCLNPPTESLTGKQWRGDPSLAAERR